MAHNGQYPFPESWKFDEKLKEETTSFAKVAYLCKNTNLPDPEHPNQRSCQVCHTYTIWKDMFNKGRKRQRQLEQEENELKAEWVANHKKGEPKESKKTTAIKVHKAGYHGRRSLKLAASQAAMQKKVKEKKKMSLKEEIAKKKKKKKDKEKKEKK